jgi:1,4-dihydroxy-2-naphthoyl-CoA hydrolase
MTKNHEADSREEFEAVLAALGPDLLGEKVGIKLISVTPEKIVATMPVAGNTQPFGLLHGGASLVLAESLGSYGAALHAGSGKSVVGLDINATHHRSARSGIVTGVATPISVGKTIASFEVVITDDSGQRICTARITCLIRDARN